MTSSKPHRSAELRMIPIGSIEVLNTRERNHRVFQEILSNGEVRGGSAAICAWSSPVPIWPYRIWPAVSTNTSTFVVTAVSMP